MKRSGSSDPVRVCVFNIEQDVRVCVFNIDKMYELCDQQMLMVRMCVCMHVGEDKRLV